MNYFKKSSCKPSKIPSVDELYNKNIYKIFKLLINNVHYYFIIFTYQVHIKILQLVWWDLKIILRKSSYKPPKIRSSDIFFIVKLTTAGYTLILKVEDTQENYRN